MTRMQTQTTLDGIETQAAAWILRREDGEFTPAARAELEAWLAADSRHRTAFLRLKEAWQFSAGLRSWHPSGRPMDPDLLVAESPRRYTVWSGRLAMAAAVVLAIGAALILRTLPDTYSTNIGGYQRVVLEDGSVLQLNTDSKAQVKFSKGHREVRLMRGEAYFDIARDPGRPFDVAAGNTVVRAVGTAFSVRMREAQRVEVMVTQGRVLLQEWNKRVSSRPLISAGESIETRATGVNLKQVRKEDMERRLAWQSGRLNFQKEPMAVVVAEFNRYNRRRIEIADPALSGLEVHGNFKATDLDSFVAALRNAMQIRVEEQENAIRLYAD